MIWDLNKSSEDYRKSWLALNRATKGSKAYEANFWVVDASIFWPQDNPGKLYEGIMLLASEDLSKSERELLGTGPIEALLAHHFGEYFPLFISSAESNSNIRHALESTYPPEEYEEQFELEIAKLLEK